MKFCCHCQENQLITTLAPRKRRRLTAASHSNWISLDGVSKASGALKDKLLKGVSGLLAASCILANCPSMAATAVSPQIAFEPVEERFSIPTEFPALKDISELPIKEVVLSNGLKVFLIEDHEVPLVKVTLAVRGGQRASPADKVGLASLSAAVLRSGGSESHPSATLDRILEELAAGIEGFALPEALVVGFQSLKEDTPQVLSLFCELLQQPQLPEEKIQLVKNQIVNYIEHRNDSPRSVPVRELAKLIYGKDSVYARQPTLEQVASISQSDVKQFLDTWLVPEGGILGVLGDFESSAMQSLLDQTLGAWKAEGQQSAPGNPASAIPDRAESAGQLYLVDFPGATQASVAMGELGVELSDPDSPSLDVLNEILNSFGGVLFNEIRSKEGLAYSVSGGFNTGAIGHKGLFVATGETAAVGELINSLERVLQEVTVRPPSPQILEAAKAKTLNSFVFNFSSSEAQLQRILGYSLVGLPQDYLFQFRDKIQAVTGDDVLSAAQRHLHPARQDIIVAADASLNLMQLQKQSRVIVPLELS